MYHYIDQNTKTGYLFFTNEVMSYSIPLDTVEVKKSEIKDLIDCPEIQAVWDFIVKVVKFEYTIQPDVQVDIRYNIKTKFPVVNKEVEGE